MLERIHIENYKCLRDVTVDLGSFTALIGPNDSGKSSFLEAVQAFGKIIKHDYKGTFQADHVPSNLVWRKDTSRVIVLEAMGSSAHHQFQYRLELPADGQPPRERLTWDGQKVFWTEDASAEAANRGSMRAGLHTIALGDGKRPVIMAEGTLYLKSFAAQAHEVATAIREALSSSVEYHFDPKKLSDASVPTPDIVLDPTGGNLAAVLDVMQNSADRSAYDAVQRCLHEAIPSLAGIVLPPNARQSGAKSLEFILSGGGKPRVTIPGSFASSGAVLLTAFLTLAYSETAGVLLFEEPENGLHPSRLQLVVEILRNMTKAAIGNQKRQTIVTTHNPILLNYVTPEEVRVFVRHAGEGTKVFSMTEIPDIDRLMKEFALGELWYLLGEEQLLQGQPA